MSASFPQATIECHSVLSWRWPSWPVQDRDVASLKFATRWPLGVARTSGSEPRLPTRMTLFTPATLHPQCDDVYVGAFGDDMRPIRARQAYGFPGPDHTGFPASGGAPAAIDSLGFQR